MFVTLPSQVTVTMTNTGTRPWRSGSYTLNSLAGASWGITRVSWPQDIQPGHDVSFQFGIRAPSTEGFYNFQWQMQNDVGQWFGSPSVNVAVQVIPQGPLPPRDLRVTAMSRREVDLRWTPRSTDQNGFYLARRVGDFGAWLPLDNVGARVTTYPDRTVSPGTTYSYRVRAFYSDGRRSPNSNEARATTLAPPPTDGHAALGYDAQTNRITTAGFVYDAAGNQTRTLRADGTWQRYQYDAAGQLAKVKNDAGETVELYTYNFARHRVRTQLGETSNARTYYVWEGNSVMTEYTESEELPSVPQWSKHSLYLGQRLLATFAKQQQEEKVQYHHPDRLGTRLVTNAAAPGYFEQVTVPYGNPLATESTGATPRPFTSYERSPGTGLEVPVEKIDNPSYLRCAA